MQGFLDHRCRSERNGYNLVGVERAQIAKHILARRFRDAEGQIVAVHVIEQRTGMKVDRVLIMELRRQEGAKVVDDLAFDGEAAPAALTVRKYRNMRPGRDWRRPRA